MELTDDEISEKYGKERSQWHMRHFITIGRKMDLHVKWIQKKPKNELTKIQRKN